MTRDENRESLSAFAARLRAKCVHEDETWDYICTVEYDVPEKKARKKVKP